MQINFKDFFLERWNRYFESASLPVCFYYTDELKDLKEMPKPIQRRCIIGDIARVLRGENIVLSKENILCPGGLMYLGYPEKELPIEAIEYYLSYLSCGIPGKLEGERYMKTPEMAKNYLSNVGSFEAPGKYIVFKRLDKLELNETPLVVTFLANADVLSGLLCLVNFGGYSPDSVISPFVSGCGSIVQYPYKEIKTSNPRSVLGMFDVSARPCVQADNLSFSVPWSRFLEMVENMDESFLITGAWQKVRRRIVRRKADQIEN